MPVLLSESDVRAVLGMDDLIGAMEKALDRFSAGGVRQPLRTIMDVGTGQAFFGVMPAFIEQPAALGTKLVSVYHSNTTRGLPSHLATIILLDPETGALQAVVDGRYITEARTAAASAASARHLARPDARVAGHLRNGRAGPEPRRGAHGRPHVRRGPYLGARPRSTREPWPGN